MWNRNYLGWLQYYCLSVNQARAQETNSIQEHPFKQLVEAVNPIKAMVKVVIKDKMWPWRAWKDKIKGKNNPVSPIIEDKEQKSTAILNPSARSSLMLQVLPSLDFKGTPAKEVASEARSLPLDYILKPYSPLHILSSILWDYLQSSFFLLLIPRHTQFFSKPPKLPFEYKKNGCSSYGVNA